MKLRGLLIVVLLLFPLTPSISATTPKAGGLCGQLGISKTYNGKKFTCIRSGKKLVWDKSVVVKQTTSIPTSTNSSPTPPSVPNPSPTPIPTFTYLQSAPIANVDECKLKDARIKKQQPNNSGFPLSPDIIPSTGKMRFIAILVDFSDAPGTDKFMAKMRAQEETFRNWFQVTSGGRSDVEWITVNKWFRAKQPSSTYVTSKGAANSANPYAETWNSYAQEFIDISGSTFDWTGVHGVFFHFAQDQKTGISSELLGRGVELNTPQGKKNLFFWASGNYLYDLESKSSSWLPDFWAALWIHEVLHSTGLSLHAPGNGFETGVGQNQSGKSWVLDAWETFKLGWYSDNQVYCAPINKLNDQIVKLEPIENTGNGIKILIVPINNTQAFIVESRRPIGFSSAWPKDVTGLYVYKLDTTLDNDRSAESNGGDSGNNPAFQKWGFYIASDQRPIDNTKFANDLYRQYLIKKGESVTKDGIKISFLESDSLDTVKISRTN